MYYHNCQNTYYAKYKPKFYLQHEKTFFGVLANHFCHFILLNELFGALYTESCI